MQLVTEMDLPHLRLTDPDFSQDPVTFVRAAQRRHPWVAKSDYGFFIHGYQAAKDLIFMDEVLSPSMDDIVDFYGLGDTRWGKFMREQMMAYTNAKHDRIRKSVRHAFSPKNVNRHLELIRTVIGDLLDEWVPKGEFDFAEFASYFPITVLCGLLGTSTQNIPEIRDAMETQVAMTTMDPELAPELLVAHDLLWNFCDKLILEREQSGVFENSVLDQLIETKNKGEIDDTELRYLLMILFPAGYDTSKNMLTMTMNIMLDHPDLWARCALDREYCDRVVREVFRYLGVTVVFRTVARDFEYDGVRFPKGEKIVFGNSIVGRDCTAFPDADTFDPDRELKNRHLGYGRGTHLCLGQYLANAQIAEGLHQIAQRIPAPRLTAPIGWRTYLGVWGPSSLPIAFDPSETRLPASAG